MTANLTDSAAQHAEEMKAALARIAAKLNMRPSLDAAEIRSAFRTMKPSERLKALNAIVETCDGPALAALTESSCLLTGLKPDDAKALRNAFIQKHAPVEFSALAKLNDGACTFHQKETEPNTKI